MKLEEAISLLNVKRPDIASSNGDIAVPAYMYRAMADILVKLAEFEVSDEFAKKCWERYQMDSSVKGICQAVIDQLREEVTL